MNIFENDSPKSLITDGTDEHNWSDDVERQLENLEKNCTRQANVCRDEFKELLFVQKHFRIPVIVISGLNSIFAVGLNRYIGQGVVSSINCLLAFAVATIGSIELYLQVTKRADTALQSYHSFYLLAVRITNCLRLDRAHRSEIDGRAFLQESLTEYERVFQQNNVGAVIIDSLISDEL